MFHITRYAKTRYWAVMCGEALVAVVLYRKGAEEIVRRLTTTTEGAAA